MRGRRQSSSEPRGSRKVRVVAVGLVLGLGLWACGDQRLTRPEQGAPVAISFQPASGTRTVFPGAGTAAGVPTEEGTLELSSVHLVVDEFKLEGNEQACEVENPTPDCAKFEAGSHLLAIPLTPEDPDPVIQEMAPAGSYTSLKFETKAVGENADLLADIEGEGIMDWPSDASLLVTGDFTPDGGDPESFRVYFDAEVKIVLPLPDPLVLTDGDEVEQTLSIEVDPRVWFQTEGGSHTDLRPLDYDATGEVQKLEVKLEEGFTKIELGG